MNIYIDESGSINNHDSGNPYFVIALVRALNPEKLRRAYKRFVSSNYNDLLEKSKCPNKMFKDDKFIELKGSALTPVQKRAFIAFFSKKPHLELFFIKLNNRKLQDKFCENTARAFNYLLCQALRYFLSKGMLPDEQCNLQLDERNEKN